MKWRPALWVTETLRLWRWRDVALGLFIGSAALFNMGGAIFFPTDFNWSRAWTYNVLQFGLPCVFATRVADRAVADGTSAWLTYALAVLAVVFGGVWVIGPLLNPIIGGEAEWTSAMDFMLAVNVLLPLSIATFAYAQWRYAHVMRTRLDASELERARGQQHIQAKRLLAIQARVEPQVLFDTLKQIHSHIGQSDTEDIRAETLLGDLIALLRIMQPHANATASNVQREFQLVRAFAKVATNDALKVIASTCQTTTEAAQAQLAPLVLLPLLRTLAQASPELNWQVDARLAGDLLVITVNAAPHSAVTAQRSTNHDDLAPLYKAHQSLKLIILDTLRARLVNVHGPTASLVIDGPTITLRHIFKSTSTSTSTSTTTTTAAPPTAVTAP